MRRHTIEDLEYDLSLLWIHEGEGVSQTALAEREGMSQGHLSRRLARARLYRQRWDEEERRASLGTDTADRDDDGIPIMHLTDDLARERRPAYELGTDRCNLESGTIKFGGGIGAIRDRLSRGQQCPDPPIEGQRMRFRNLNSGHKDAEATRQHKPDPAGLKGGVG